MVHNNDDRYTLPSCYSFSSYNLYVRALVIIYVLYIYRSVTFLINRTASTTNTPLVPLSISVPRGLLIFLDKQYSELVRLYFVPLMFISSYVFEVLSLDVVILDESDVLDERSLFRSPGSQLVDFSLVGNMRFQCVQA